jgi:PTH1 family peptidyl-tRNA hydrolase
MQSSPEGSSTYLIVGLGNPGRQYQNSRHNIGFMLISHLAHKLNTTFSRMESKALVTKANYLDRQIILAKPQTYMNLSGSSVVPLTSFYKVPLESFLVVYDDVDLPFGRIRMRPGGGSAGQKGIASIIERFGTDEFPRMRLGIGRPPGRGNAASYVLRDFSSDEEEFLGEFLDRASEAVLVFIAEGLTSAMNQFNSQVDWEIE